MLFEVRSPYKEEKIMITESNETSPCIFIKGAIRTGLQGRVGMVRSRFTSASKHKMLKLNKKKCEFKNVKSNISSTVH